jgi:hypothetical protein
MWTRTWWGDGTGMDFEHDEKTRIVLDGRNMSRAKTTSGVSKWRIEYNTAHITLGESPLPISTPSRHPSPAFHGSTLPYKPPLQPPRPQYP